jgi:hypothetical protein
VRARSPRPEELVTPTLRRSPAPGHACSRRAIGLGLIAAWTSTLSATATTLGCAAHSEETAVAPSEPAAPAPSSVVGLPSPPARRFEPARLEASIDGVGVVLDAASAVLTAWSDEPTDLRVQIEATALQIGVGAQLFSSFDFARPFVMEASFPRADDGALEDTFGALYASIPAIDPRGLVDALPETRKPRSIGDRLWQVEQDEVSLFLREDAGALVVATERAALDRAASLPRQLGPGPRVRLAFSGIQPAYDEPWSSDPIIVIEQILERASAYRFGMDFEKDHDLVTTLTASAPLDALGVDLLGAPLRAPTLLGDRLPGGAAAAVQLTDVSLKRAEDYLRSEVPTLEIPAPFDVDVKRLANALADLLGEAGGETVLALYVDSKQQVALVLATRLRDESRARGTLRTVLQTTQTLFAAHSRLVVDVPDYRYSASFATDAEKIGGVAVDRLRVTVPKIMQRNAAVRGLGVLLGRSKPKLEVLGAVRDGFGVIVIGPGSRSVLSQILAGNVADDLEVQGALPRVRELTGGCQLCVVADARQMLHLTALVRAHAADDATERRSWEKLGKRLMGSAVRGVVLFGVRVTDREGHFAASIPRELLFAPRKDTRIVEEIVVGDASGRPVPVRPTDLLPLP